MTRAMTREHRQAGKTQEKHRGHSRRTTLVRTTDRRPPSTSSTVGLHAEASPNCADLVPPPISECFRQVQNYLAAR